MTAESEDKDLGPGDLAGLATLVQYIQSARSPEAAARRAGVTFEHPADLPGGLVLRVPVYAKPGLTIVIALGFGRDFHPRHVVPTRKLLALDGALLEASGLVDDAVVEAATAAQGETVDVLKRVGEQIVAAANDIHALASRVPHGPLPFKRAAGIWWLEQKVVQ